MNRSSRLVLGVVLGAFVLLLAGRASTFAQNDKPAPAKPAGAIATCDIFAVIDALLQSDRFAPRLEAKREELSQRIEPLEDRLRALQNELQNANPDDPSSQERFAEFQQLIQMYQTMGPKLEAEFSEFRGKLTVEAYELAKGATEGIAETKGFDYVLAGRSPSKPIKSTDLQQLLQAILGRPMLHQPEGTDITDDVFEDLNLELL